MFFKEANTPEMQIGTATSPKLGAHKINEPINPDCITLSSGTSYSPPKLHLEAGHITGSQALYINWHCAGPKTSSHLIAEGLNFFVVSNL